MLLLSKSQKEWWSKLNFRQSADIWKMLPFNSPDAVLFMTIKLGKEKAGENFIWLKAGQPCLLCGEVSAGMLRVRLVTLSLLLLPAGLAWGRQWPQTSQRLRHVHVWLHRGTQDWCNRLSWTETGWEVWVQSILWRCRLGECSCQCLSSATAANQCSEKARLTLVTLF